VKFPTNHFDFSRQNIRKEGYVLADTLVHPALPQLKKHEFFFSKTEQINRFVRRITSSLLCRATHSSIAPTLPFLRTENKPTQHKWQHYIFSLTWRVLVHPVQTSVGSHAVLHVARRWIDALPLLVHIGPASVGKRKPNKHKDDRHPQPHPEAIVLVGIKQTTSKTIVRVPTKIENILKTKKSKQTKPHSASIRGMQNGYLRTTRWHDADTFEISLTKSAPLSPMPTTITRFPRNFSTLSKKLNEWSTLPPNPSRFSTRGKFGF